MTDRVLPLTSEPSELLGHAVSIIEALIDQRQSILWGMRAGREFLTDWYERVGVVPVRRCEQLYGESLVAGAVGIEAFHESISRGI